VATGVNSAPLITWTAPGAGEIVGESATLLIAVEAENATCVAFTWDGTPLRSFHGEVPASFIFDTKGETNGEHVLGVTAANSGFTAQDTRTVIVMNEFGCSAVGRKAPVFTLSDMEGQSRSLRDCIGREAVLIHFWASWSGPSRLAMPGMQQNQNEFGKSGLRVWAVSIDTDPEQACEFIDREGYTVCVLLDPSNVTPRLYCIDGLPTAVLIDAEGTVRHLGSPDDLDREKIRKFLPAGAGDDGSD
jgi:peroxiredoxin